MSKHIRFDVGHYIYVCNRDLILKHSESMLARLVANSEEISEFEYYNIDRDGRYFKVILDFLRDERSLKLSKIDRRTLTMILEEAKFYCLDRLIQLCEDELLNRDNSTISDIKTFESNEDLEDYVKNTKKLILLLSYKSYMLRHRDEMEEIFPVLNESKVDVVGFMKFDRLGDNVVGLIDPLSKRIILSYSNPDRINIFKLVNLINSYGSEIFASKLSFERLFFGTDYYMEQSKLERIRDMVFDWSGPLIGLVCWMLWRGPLTGLVYWLAGWILWLVLSGSIDHRPPKLTWLLKFQIVPLLILFWLVGRFGFVLWFFWFVGWWVWSFGRSHLVHLKRHLPSGHEFGRLWAREDTRWNLPI
jgi:hypothetical protein